MNQDTDHAALPCPLYAGGDCGMPHPTTTTTSTTVATHHGGLPLTGGETLPLLSLGIVMLCVGLVVARLARFWFFK